MDSIFVYGTLLRGLRLNHVLDNSIYVGSASTYGQLYDLGCYPAIVTGEKEIVGELYQVDSTTLKVLDEIEGYYPAAIEQSLYIRSAITATLLDVGKTIEAETYLYNRSVTNSIYIPNGDYREYLIENLNSDLSNGHRSEVHYG